MTGGRFWFISRKNAKLSAAWALNNDLLHRTVLNINGSEPFTYQKFLDIANGVSGNHISHIRKTDEELYSYINRIGMPKNTDGDFSKSSIKATSERMVSVRPFEKGIWRYWLATSVI